MRKAAPEATVVGTKSLKPLSPAEIMARDGVLSSGDESFSVIEEWFVESPTPPRSRRTRTTASELTAYAEARPLTRREIAAKEATAELRDPNLMGTHDGSFLVPKPPEESQSQIPPASTAPWE